MAQWVASLGIWWYVLFYLAIQLINVVLNTLKTIITSRGKKIPASIINALTFGFYTIVIALTADVSNLWVNMAVTIVANLVGVYFSIAVLDKLRKDKLWEVTATAVGKDACEIEDALLVGNIAYNKQYTMKLGANEQVFHIYCPTQKESQIVKKILVDNNAKYIVHEENAQL